MDTVQQSSVTPPYTYPHSPAIISYTCGCSTLCYMVTISHTCGCSTLCYMVTISHTCGCNTLVYITFTYPLTARVAGAPQMTSQSVFSIFPCSPLPSGTWRTPGLSITWRCLPTSSSVSLVFFPLSLCLARWFWPDLQFASFYDHQEIFMWSNCLLDLGIY